VSCHVCRARDSCLCHRERLFILLRSAAKASERGSQSSLFKDAVTHRVQIMAVLTGPAGQHLGGRPVDHTNIPGNGDVTVTGTAAVSERAPSLSGEEVKEDHSHRPRSPGEPLGDADRTVAGEGYGGTTSALVGKLRRMRSAKDLLLSIYSTPAHSPNLESDHAEKSTPNNPEALFGSPEAKEGKGEAMDSGPPASAPCVSQEIRTSVPVMRARPEVPVRLRRSSEAGKHVDADVEGGRLVELNAGQPADIAGVGVGQGQGQGKDKVGMGVRRGSDASASGWAKERENDRSQLRGNLKAYLKAVPWKVEVRRHDCLQFPTLRSITSCYLPQAFHDCGDGCCMLSASDMKTDRELTM